MTIVPVIGCRGCQESTAGRMGCSVHGSVGEGTIHRLIVDLERAEKAERALGEECEGLENMMRHFARADGLRVASQIVRKRVQP